MQTFIYFIVGLLVGYVIGGGMKEESPSITEEPLKKTKLKEEPKEPKVKKEKRSSEKKETTKVTSSFKATEANKKKVTPKKK